jgi:hypothetical protein
VRLAAAAGSALAALLLAACGSSSPSTYEATTPANAKQMMVEYLNGKHLTYHWVACLRSGRSFQGAGIVRCNVNFGDPHIEAYCIVLRHGKLYSDHTDPAIPCQRDNRAPPATIVTS